MCTSLVAKNTKRIIKEKGLLQYAVAERLKMRPKTFNNMLNDRKIITDVDIINIANALNVEPNELFRTDE